MIRNKTFMYLLLLLNSLQVWINAQTPMNQRLILPDQGKTNWWTGVITHGHVMPLQNGYHAELFGDTYGNQVQPLLLSANGEYIWSEEPFAISFRNDSLIVESNLGKIYYSREGRNLREAYLNASRAFFPPSGKLPDLELIRKPQYNTWIELMYNQNQEDILKYANDLINNGFPPGVLMIDDNWQEDYGNWDFHPGRFPDPMAMMDSLHQLGFKVMMWICPFLSPDSYISREVEAKGYLLKDKKGKTAVVHWWNGYSTLLDLSNPDAFQWFGKQLEYLVEKYRVDGFKLDAGDAEYYMDLVSYKDITPNDHSTLFNLYGLQYPLNEYRVAWKMGGQPLVQRIRDKGHNWEDLRLLIPHLTLQGIMGYPFTCPDMIGGGEFATFLNISSVDQELIVRSTQVHALMPMMQYSVAPWRVLDAKHLEASRKAVVLREKYIDLILDLTGQAALTGEPVVRSMEYVFPKSGYADVKDQFMLGDHIMVAPMLEKGSLTRDVIIPKGRWKADDNKIYRGPAIITISVSLERIPVFERIK
jgi:alpha-glucosidase (family GH31 glycosyl hydrolase)